MYGIFAVSEIKVFACGQHHGMYQTGGCHTGFLTLIHHTRIQAIRHYLTPRQQFFMWCRTHTIGLYSTVVTEFFLLLIVIEIGIPCFLVIQPQHFDIISVSS